MYIGNRLRDTLCARFDIYFVLGNSSAAQTCSDTARSAGRAARAPPMYDSAAETLARLFQNTDIITLTTTDSVNVTLDC